jgi:hypothetical protein
MRVDDMTTQEAWEEAHKNDKDTTAKDLAIFGAMCATCGTKFTLWFYGIGLLIVLILWLTL